MKTETQRDYEKRMLRVLVHIQTHLDDALDLEALARVAHFSPYHFHRVFRGMVGEPIVAHVRRLRLERAAYQLKTTDHSVTNIAFDAGFETHEAFTRAFRGMFDLPPSRFRERHQMIPVRRVPCGVHYSSRGTVEGFEAVLDRVDNMNVRVEQMQGMRVAFMRHVGPYNEVGPLWQKFMGWAFSRGLFGNGKILGICHDDPDVTPPEKVRYDACIQVDGSFEPEGDIGVQEVAGGEYAVATHEGPHENIGTTYGALLGQWLPTHNREPGKSPCFEIYLNNPQDTKPEDLLTDVYVPLA